MGSARSVPLTPIVCGVLGALSAICSVADRAPAAPARGVKVTLIMQVPPGGTAIVQPLALKSPGFPPVNVRPVTERDCEPVAALLVMVTVCAVLVVP